MHSKTARLSALALAVSAAAAGGLTPRAADACAMVVPNEAGATPARLAGEATFIAYDADTHVEHFVRAVRFASSVQRFGFLVPVPTKPTIGEAQEALFDKLEELARSKPLLTRSAPPTAAVSVAATPGVTVVEQAKVKGLDYAVLQASGGKELNAWLEQNKFVSYPELAPWAEHYAKEDAFFVAFKYELPSAGQIAEALPGAVRITFTTDRPFYPYREPKPQGGPGGRSLRLFVLGEGPVSTTVAGSPWATTATFSEAIPAHEATNLETFLPGARVSSKATHLTAFNDTTVERPAGDLFFAFRPAILSVKLALLLLGGGLSFGAIALLLRRRRQRLLGAPPAAPPGPV
ncbi:MAG: DUF2330 domain-containing protein [Deltaproteobacteria bacterium]|nr:DUF2330 domain-containing protein [Deltaproteobacteria bacterium]